MCEDQAVAQCQTEVSKLHMSALLESDPVEDIVDLFRMHSNLSDGGEAAKQGFPDFARFLRGPFDNRDLS